MDDWFAERWRRKECECGLGDVASKVLACEPAALPDSAAPCVTFKEASHPIPLLQKFGSPSDWSISDRERLASFYMIGSDGAGNAICLEDITGTVVLLDHEDWFHTRQFVNSSVYQLAECLLAYLGEQDPIQFRTAVLAIDPKAMEPQSYWWHEAAVLGK